MKATLYLLDQAKEAEKKASERVSEMEDQVSKMKT